MRFSKLFIKSFLIAFVFLIILNVIFLAIGNYSKYLGYLTGFFFLFLLFLIFRKRKERTVKFLAYFIPIAIILVFLYMNFLPFGYNKTYTMNIDENGTIHSPSSHLWLQNENGTKLTSISEDYEFENVTLVLTSKIRFKDADAIVEIYSFNPKEEESSFFVIGKEIMNGREFQKDIEFNPNIRLINLKIYQKTKLTMTGYIGPESIQSLK
jgi:hypothetical protein